MSSSGGNTDKKGSSDRDNSSSRDTSKMPSSAKSEPTIIKGWEHATYAHRHTERYGYVGKDDDGEP
ncbi:hypothetical protein HDU98_009930, partial [Podochytrium sp. JEL0797]